MRQLKKFKLSMPNTGLMFIIAGMAVANYSYDNYQKKYMSSSSSSTNNMDSARTSKNIHEQLGPDTFVPYDKDDYRDKGHVANINISTEDEDLYRKQDEKSELNAKPVPVHEGKSSNYSNSSPASLPTPKQLKIEKLKKADKYVKTNYI